MVSKEFGKEVRKLREEANLSQKELADKIGVSASYLCKIEKGVSPYFPSSKVVKNLSELLEVEKNFLMSFSNKISEEVREDYIYLVKKYPETTNLLKKMVEDSRFAEEVIAKIKMEYLL
ncbi:helix-turn-helix domain-containing protein [Okeania sp. SIO2B9]|uniref:helix-turn-helix domain-containing protein n=1 Tax=Okeania sp. SIO2B9 TaxID=2607782 RepID=UPI00142C80AC|nr:helix-turn-helix transcriptional regulator [Okeania sp. SIO2B9]NES89568.1 helix-turn-helix transcriptional regulator [Okeania sp. SIO2B9]